MRRLPVLSLTAALALASAVVAACDRAGAQTAAPAPAASASAPVTWDYASNDPARNPDAANKEASVPGFNP